MESFEMFWENRNPLSRLYHKTSVKSLINILGSNEFKLVAANSVFERFILDRRAKKNYNTVPVYNYKKNYYFSAARSMYNSYYMDGNHYRRPFQESIDLDTGNVFLRRN